VLSQNTLSVEIAGFPQAGITNLRTRCKTLFGREPLSHLRRCFLTRAIAYRLQERVYGGLKPSASRQLASAAEESATASPKRPQLPDGPGQHYPESRMAGQSQPRHGARRRRAVFKGERYRSLSELARAITGSRWSRPRFFGLRAPLSENHAAR
jgi:hypothetical protein